MAEEKLCLFLKYYDLKLQGGRLQHDFPTRTTDWPFTYQNKLLQVPTIYIDSQYQDFEYLAPLRGVLGLLRRWRNILNNYGLSERVKRLDDVLRQFRSSKYTSVELTQQYFNRITQAYPDIYTHLHVLRNIDSITISPQTKSNAREDFVTRIARSFTKRRQTDDIEIWPATNADYALELVARYSIIITAIRKGWHFESSFDAKTPASAILYNSDKTIKCFITKGAPENIIKKIIFSDDAFYHDKLSARFREWGLQNNKSAKQPDIVMLFIGAKHLHQNIKERKVRFCFADAKNNQGEKNHGADYIKLAITETFKYFFTHGHLFSQPIDFSKTDWPPYFSLFVTQKTPKLKDECAVKIFDLDILSHAENPLDKWWLTITPKNLDEIKKLNESKNVEIKF
jgi:hypothetical protein